MSISDALRSAIMVELAEIEYFSMVVNDDDIPAVNVDTIHDAIMHHVTNIREMLTGSVSDDKTIT